MRAVIAIAATTIGLALGACGSSERPQARRTVEVRIGAAHVLAEVAAGADARRQGLSGRARLAEGRGMLFVYRDSAERAYWMKGMRFPIDIVWIDRGRVTGVERDVPVPAGGPLPLYSSGAPVDRVLEVRAGWAARHHVGRGDRVAVR